MWFTICPPFAHLSIRLPDFCLATFSVHPNIILFFHEPDTLSFCLTILSSCSSVSICLMVYFLSISLCVILSICLSICRLILCLPVCVTVSVTAHLSDCAYQSMGAPSLLYPPTQPPVSLTSMCPVGPSDHTLRPDHGPPASCIRACRIGTPQSCSTSMQTPGSKARTKWQGWSHSCHPKSGYRWPWGPSSRRANADPRAAL